ncbi:MAG: hypothetical protein LBG28_09220, partial [Tannerella sp.]|nr:hypothetical protein [Tannerella sp.]
MLTLVITEKKDAAKSIAGFLETGIRDKGAYLEGRHYLFTWCAGHLIELAEPDVYTGNKKWKLEELPIMPN